MLKGIEVFYDGKSGGLIKSPKFIEDGLFYNEIFLNDNEIVDQIWGELDEDKEALRWFQMGTAHMNTKGIMSIDTEVGPNPDQMFSFPAEEYY